VADPSGTAVSNRLKIAQAKKEAKKKKVTALSNKRAANATTVSNPSVFDGTTLGAFMQSVEAHPLFRYVQQRFSDLVERTPNLPLPNADVTASFRYLFWSLVWLLALAVLSWFSAGLLFIVASVLCYLWFATRKQSAALNSIVQPPTLRVPQPSSRD
jgi:hypothetical protein